MPFRAPSALYQCLEPPVLVSMVPWLCRPFQSDGKDQNQLEVRYLSRITNSCKCSTPRLSKFSYGTENDTQTTICPSKPQSIERRKTECIAEPIRRSNPAEVSPMFSFEVFLQCTYLKLYASGQLPTECIADSLEGRIQL